MKKCVEQQSRHVIKVSYVPSDCEKLMDSEKMDFCFDNRKLLSQTGVKFVPKEVYEYTVDGEAKFSTKKTANGDVTYIENAQSRFVRNSYSAVLELEVGEKELLLGLGQYEDGVFDYRNHTEYMYESNMRIALPILMTTGGYAVYIDTGSNMIFKSEGNTVRFEIDTASELTYYVIFGENIDELILHFQELTGKAAMMPRFIYGYVQSKEHYHTGEELVRTAKEFRRRDIPIDVLVQDWFTWDDGLWGEKILDKKRYPDFPKTVGKLHDDNIRLMFSIWPNIATTGENYKEFEQNDGLLPNSNVYNAFSEECRRIYWEQCEREIMSAGIDALWCDNSEPFSDADWSGEKKRPEKERYERVVSDSKKSIEWEQLNLFGLYHAKGIYENWRKNYPQRRVVNLTRSGYISSQKYGAILWSGDISAKWETLRNQITEGLKMGLCGNPYWTLDIGGFFVRKAPMWFWNGDFMEGVKDAGYRELYTRWLQFGAFLPVFRSHGTDTPREPWNFINEDDCTLPFYETIVKFIRLRYHLLPYIYSLGYKAHSEAYIMMRALAFDFADDERAAGCTDEYMFGPSFLAAPVYEAMYYAPGNVRLENRDLHRIVYLPQEGSVWYDYWTSTCYDGGREIAAAADITTMPLFVRAGSIIPVSADISYSGQNNGAANEVFVYEGADGCFDLYNDSGDGYEYENGSFYILSLAYSDREKVLRIKKSAGDMSAECNLKATLIRRDGTHAPLEIRLD